MDTVESLTIQADGIRDLVSIRKWTFFLAIMGFIGSGFTVVLALFFAVFSRFIPQEEALSKVPAFFLSGLYFFLGIIYFIPSLFLLQFSGKTKKALNTGDTSDFENALQYLRFHFTYMGGLVILCLGISILAIFAGIIIGIISAAHVNP